MPDRLPRVRVTLRWRLIYRGSLHGLRAIPARVVADVRQGYRGYRERGQRTLEATVYAHMEGLRSDAL